MKIVQSGYNYCHDESFRVERPNGVDDYLLLIFRSPARITLNDHDYYTTGNAMIVYSKQTPQFFGAHDAKFINDWVQFDMDEDDLAFCKDAGISFDTLMEFNDIYPLSNIAKQLFLERWSKNKYAENSKELLLHLLLYKLGDMIASKTVASSQFAMRLTHLRKRIFENPDRDWSISQICKNLSISPSYLRFCYKKLYGTTIQDDVISSRIERGKHLLSNTCYNVSDIANMVGYDNDVHFMYMFKKKTGFTPSQYRKSSSTYLGLTQRIKEVKQKT